MNKALKSVYFKMINHQSSCNDIRHRDTLHIHIPCVCMFFFFLSYVQDVGFQHGKLLFTGWARGDIIENMLKDHRSADYTDSKKTDVSVSETQLNQFRMQNQS